MPPELIDMLKEYAKDVCLDDNDEDFNPGDQCGGNYDDCYSRGRDDGAVFLAREILDQLGIDYTQE